MLTEKGKNFCWGGGTAIRRSVFEQIGVLDDWRTSVSDDYSLTSALERTHHSILFIPECLTFLSSKPTFAGLMEFTNRQILITRVYAEKMWRTRLPRIALLRHSSPRTGPCVRRASRSATALPIVAVTFLILLLSAIRSALRVVGVTEIFPAHEH